MNVTTTTEHSADELAAFWLRLVSDYGIGGAMSVRGASPATLRAARTAASNLARCYARDYNCHTGVQGEFWCNADGSRNEERVALAYALNAAEEAAWAATPYAERVAWVAAGLAVSWR